MLVGYSFNLSFLFIFYCIFLSTHQITERFIIHISYIILILGCWINI